MCVGSYIKIVLFMFNFPKSLVVNPRGCVDLYPLSVLQNPFPVHLLECDNISRGSSSQLESKAVVHRYCFNLHFPTAGLFVGREVPLWVTAVFHVALGLWNR